MERWTRMGLIGLLLAAVIGGMAGGQEIHTAVSPAVMQRIFREMDLEAVQFSDSKGDPAWQFTYQGILMTLVSYDRQTGDRFASLLFYAGWTTVDSVSVDLINAWNRGARFGRAYVDAQGDPVIELDLLLRGGVASETIKAYINVFAESAQDLASVFP